MQNKLHIIVTVLATCALSGCGQQREQAERDRQRMLAEEQAQREIKKSNEAVNEVSKKLGRKPPAMDIGVPIEKKAAPDAPASESSPKK